MIQRKFTVLILISLLFSSVASKAQQDPQFSQNMFTKLVTNPGFAGANDAICGTLLYRNQWTGFDGPPKSMLLAADMPVEILHGGIGLTVIGADQLGAEKNLSLHGSYAYRTNLGPGAIG